jgi:hypothetical protein
MEAIGTNSINSITQKAAAQTSYGLSTFADLNVKTEEGDLVSISFSNEFNYSESSSSTQFANGESIREFSVSASAAFQYSLTVQGDLNEEELAAIEKLAQSVSPLAQSFFSQSGFDARQAASVLSGSLGTLTDIELNLERAETASAVREYFENGNAEGVNQLANDIAEEFPAEQIPKIRDLAGLVQSVLDAVFNDNEEKFPEDRILKSLEDFKILLENQLVQALEIQVEETARTEETPETQPETVAILEPVVA